MRRSPSPEQLTWLVEDVEFMLDHGEHPERTARRAGLTLATLARRMDRAERADLARVFRTEESRQRDLRRHRQAGNQR